MRIYFAEKQKEFKKKVLKSLLFNLEENNNFFFQRVDMLYEKCV